MRLESSLSTAEPQPTIDGLALLESHALDWARVHRVTYLLHQRLTYTYLSPVRNLRHRLMVIPGAHHGDQRRIMWRLDVEGVPVVRADEHCDEFANLVIDVRASRVEDSVGFEAWAVVERTTASEVPTHAYPTHDPRWSAPSRLTRPDGPLRTAARLAQKNAAPGTHELALYLSHWVYTAMTYAPDATSVSTTAAQALRLREGVCQDYAHILIALCRLSGIPARYVSGHLVGEGGSHAWVEVLIPAPQAAGRQRSDGSESKAQILALDPTHDRAVGMQYLTVAVGRDYGDVAPTSGSFTAISKVPEAGGLQSAKQLGVTDVHIAA